MRGQATANRSGRERHTSESAEGKQGQKLQTISMSEASVAWPNSTRVTAACSRSAVRLAENCKRGFQCMHEENTTVAALLSLALEFWFSFPAKRVSITSFKHKNRTRKM